MAVRALCVSAVAGDTGPPVYPAGFLYLFSGLRYLTDAGKSILSAQYIFLGLYVATVIVVVLIYRRCPVQSPPPMPCLDHRAHALHSASPHGPWC